MNAITVTDFAKEKGMRTVTIYKKIKNSGMQPVGFAEGATRPHALYCKDSLDVLCKMRVKKSDDKNTFNVSKLW